MENNETNKLSKKQIIVIVSLLVAVLIIGVTIAYFMSRQTGAEQTITSGNLSITYTNENAFNLTGLIPLAEEEVQDKASKIEFTITNNGNLKAYVEIGMTDITIPEEFKNQDFMYAIYDENNNMITSGDFSGIGNNTEMSMYQDIEFEVGDSKDYTAYIWINETPDDQTSMMGKTFKGKMQITGYLKPLNYRDNSGANSPKLADGMIPVVYDETSENWEVADTSKEWYNYDEQWWANAVTTSEASYRTAEAGTEIPMEDINSMWVWIPRYKYRIPSNIGSSSAVGTPPEIDVVFENGTNTTGLAGKNQELLISEGFNVTAATTYQGEQQDKTRIIVYAEGMGYDLLEYYPDAEIIVDSEQLTGNTDNHTGEPTDILIILGNNNSGETSENDGSNEVSAE